MQYAPPLFARGARARIARMHYPVGPVYVRSSNTRKGVFAPSECERGDGRLSERPGNGSCSFAAFSMARRKKMSKAALSRKLQARVAGVHKVAFGMRALPGRTASWGAALI